MQEQQQLNQQPPQVESNSPSKDYVHPPCQLTGTDGNVFALLGQCGRALRKAGHADMAKELQDKVFKCGSYDSALALMAEYVDAG